MDLISNYFPFVSLYFQKDGMSISEANRIAEKYKNENTFKTLFGDHFNTKTIIIDKDGITCKGETTVGLNKDRIKKEIEQIAVSNGEIAKLKFKIKLYKKLRDMILNLKVEDIFPERPQIKSIVIDHTRLPENILKNIMEEDNFDKIIDTLLPYDIEYLNFNVKGLEVQSIAATYGKVLHNDGWLGKAINQKENELFSEEKFDTFKIQLYRKRLPEDQLHSIFELFQNEFDEKQKQRNGYMKMFKDHIRKVHAKKLEENTKINEEIQKANKLAYDEIARQNLETQMIKNKMLQEHAALKI